MRHDESRFKHSVYRLKMTHITRYCTPSLHYFVTMRRTLMPPFNTRAQPFHASTPPLTLASAVTCLAATSRRLSCHTSRNLFSPLTHIATLITIWHYYCRSHYEIKSLIFIVALGWAHFIFKFHLMPVNWLHLRWLWYRLSLIYMISQPATKMLFEEYFRARNFAVMHQYGLPPPYLRTLHHYPFPLSRP